jgi:hypothetical protein
MKARTYLFYLLPLTVLLLLILSLALAGVLGFDIDPLRLLGIVRKENSVSSQILFERIQALQELHTVRYIYKTVFPFDYMDPQISFSGILSTLRRGKGSVNTLLSPKEREYLEARELADAVGLRITGNTDIPLTPDRWKRIATFTAVKVQERAEQGEILKSAWDQIVAFLSTFLQQAGITEIEFEEAAMIK